MPIKKEKLDAINGYRDYQKRKKEEALTGASSKKTTVSSSGTNNVSTVKTQSTTSDKKAVVKKEKLDAIPGYREWETKKTARNTSNVSNAAAVSVKLQEAKRQERDARERLSRLMVSGSWKETEQTAAARNAAKIDYENKTATRKALESELENIKFNRKYDEYQDKTYDDTFTGQFGANYTAGRLNQDSSLAWNDYLMNPTEENKVRAEAIDELLTRFQENNAAALDDDGAVLPWISKSAANYLPQLIDQTKYSAAGGITGAVAGSVIPGVGTALGAKAGIVSGSGLYSYQTMRGAAYSGLLDLGVDEETARAAANDEAVISSLIEMADTGVDIATLGVGKLLNLIGKGGVKAVAGGAAEGAAKKLLKGLAGYGLNIGGEMMEEATQEAVSIANERRMANGETGILNLANDAARTFTGSITGKESDENRDRIWEAAKEGGKIAAMMGGATRVATGITNAAIENQVGKQFNNMGQESVQAVIETGLESDKNSESYKMASALKEKQDNGKAITNREIGRLYQENVKTVDAEQVQTRTENRKSFQQQVKKATGYGEYGVKAISDLMESENMPLSQLRTRFQTAYEAGLTNMPRAKASLTTDIQQIAFNAGKQDYIMSQKRDVEKSNYATVYGKDSGFIQTDASKGVQQSTIDMLHEVSKDLGIKTRYEEAIVLEDGSEANGSMSNDGIFRISRTSEHPEYVLVAHEGLHRMQQLAPEAYYAFRDFAVQTSQWYEGRLESGVVSGSQVEGLQLKYQQHGMTLQTDEAMDEIAAQFAEKLFSSDEDVLNTIREGVKDVDARNALQKFFDIVKDLARKLKETVSRLKNKGKTEEAAQVQDVVDNLEHARKLWNDAYQASKVAAQEKTRQEGQTASSAHQDTKAAASVKSQEEANRNPVYTASEDFYDSTEKYSIKVTDKDTLDFLDSQETITTYKTMQLVDGKLYPPMASRIDGKFEDYSELGKWEQATEHPELIRNGNKFKLDKGKGQGSLEAAYNPYMHSSNLVINDQFTGAYTRNNLVTVECEVPVSEMTSGYHAQYAKDSVGWHSWHTGTVAGQIRKAKGVERQVFLSRWIKPVRIVPDAEVASMYKELLDGTNVEVPDNVVTPSLLAELKKAGVKIKESGRVKYSMNVAESETITNKSGDVVAEYLPDGSAQFSLKTYREDGRSNLKKWLDKRVSSNSISQVDADDIIRQLDEFYDICQKFTGKYAPFSAWSNAEVVRGANGKPVFSVVKANGEYAMNLDFSLVCKKRRTLDAVFREMINRGILDNMELREAQIAGINQIIRDSGFETACALCFVDSKRYRQANVADNFVTQYNDMVKMLIPEGKGIEAHYFDFLDRGMKGQGRALDKVSDKEIGKGILKLKQVMQENKKGTVPYKIAWHLLNNPQDRKLLTRSEFMNTDGFEALNVKNKKILGLYNSSKGSGGPKASLSDVQYLGDILKKNNFTPAKAYAVGGVRIQSFSDYIPRLVFDYLQMTADLTAKKLPAHAYTKEEMFAKQFGMTGIKINMSLVPAVVKDGIAPGLDANGNYVWYDGQSFGSDVNVKGSGQTGFKTAVEIQNAEGYSANCGTIAVGISDEHIWKMLDDPDIRMIIPYHKSSLNHIVAVMNNIDQYNDYTDVQNTRDAKTGTKITGKDFNYNEALRRLGDAKAAANEYLEWCDENGYLPKFDTFAEHENYYKLLEDFSTYDNGEAAPQGAVTMTFPKSGDAFGSMSELIERGLEEDAILEGRRQSDVPGIVDKIEAAFKTTGDTKFSLKEQNKLMKENAQLKETVEGLREQFKTTKFAQVDKKSLDRFTKQLLKDYKSDAEINDTRDALNDLYTYLANGENGEAPVWNEAYSRAYDVAVSILENASTLDDEMYQEYADLRKYLRTVGMTLDRQYSHDLYGYENLKEFRKAYMGRIKLVNDGIPVDAVYQELAARYPEFFDETRDMNPADMLTTIAETLDKLQPVEVNPYSYNMREAATWLANDIMERFYELPQSKPTFADKAETKLTKQVIKDAKKLERLREQKNERIKDIIEKNREKVKTVRSEERVKREEAVQTVKEHYKAKEVRGSENRRAREIRAKIIRHVGDMSEKLLKPTDKQHIPESLRGPVAAMLEAINLESQYTIDQETGKRTKSDDGMPTKRTTAFLALKEEYARIAAAQDGDMVIDPSLLGSDADGIRGSFDAVIAMRDIRLADMNVEQLNTVWSVIRAVEHSISTEGKMLASEKYARTVDWADAFVEDTGTRRAKKSLTKNHAMIDMETPYTFFSHYGEAGHAVYRMLRDAQDQQQVMVNKVAAEVSKIVDSKTVKALEKKTHTFTTERGEKLTLTTAHIMELRELMKREQAQDHLMKGGIVQPEIKSARIRRGTDAILLTAGDLANITKTLTPEQAKIADDLQALTTGLLADYGNEASMKAYGYKKFTGADYWPIKSAREAVHSNIEKGGNNTRSIKNIGMAKSVMPHANNPLDIAGIFSTFSNHAADMTDYAAWLCPMEDANRLYNFKFKDESGQQTGKTVKGLLDRVGGAGSQKYWHNLMEDIQNGINAPGDSAMWDIVGKSIGNFKGAAVGANLRVVIQQPTAFFRANAVLSPADLSRGLVSGVTKGSGWKKALQYSPIAMRKNVGGFDISNPYQMNEILFDSRTGVRKLNDALSAPAGAADAVTWGRLWNACEWAVAREHKDLEKGSSEFYSAVSQKFMEVIDQTQVVDGVLQRSQIMRSSNAVVKQATSFMGEPIMSYNLMLRAYDQVRYEQNPKRRGKALKVLGRAATALVVTNVVNALAQSVIDGLRDDDEDKEYWDRFWSAFTGLEGDEESAWDKAVAAVLNGNVGSNMNPLDQIPFVKDALSLFQGYDVNRTELEIMADLIDAGQTVAESIDGTGKKTRAYAIKELFSAGAKAFGIPASNLAREVWSIARSIAVGTDNIPVQYEMEKAIYNLTNDSNKARYYDIMFRALVQGDMTSYQRIRDDLMNQMGLDGVTIDNAMKSRYKKAQAATPGFALSQDVLDRIGTRDREATENDEDRFSDKALNAAQYQQYSTQRANDYRDIMDDLQQYSSYRSMDAEGRNALEAAAWSYAKETALEDASGGKYQTDTKWIDSAQDADDIGLTVAEYIMLKEQYSDTALRSDGVYDAYDAGIPVDVYLEAHDAMGDIKADKDANGKSISGSRKEKIIDYLNALGLTYEQYLYLLGTEYDTVKKTQDYISFFGSQK